MNRLSRAVYLAAIVVSCAFWAQDSLARELVDRIVAVVNAQIITLSELNEFIAKQSPRSQASDAVSKMLDQLIDTTLIDQESMRLGIVITEDDIDIAIDGVRDRFGMNAEQLTVALKEQNLTPEQFREQWRTQLLTTRLMSSILGTSIAITDEEIDEKYEEEFGLIDPEVETHLAHILIRIEGTEEEALERASSIAELARSGKDFGKLSQEHSDDPISAEKGGDLGFWKQGELSAPLEVAIAGVEPGTIVGPVKSDQGFHIIKVLEKQETGRMSIDEEERAKIKETLYQVKVKETLKKWVKELRTESHIERKI